MTSRTASESDNLGAKFDDAYDELVGPLTRRIKADKSTLRTGIAEAELFAGERRRRVTFSGQMKRRGKLLAAADQTLPVRRRLRQPRP